MFAQSLASEQNNKSFQARFAPAPANAPLKVTLYGASVMDMIHPHLSTCLDRQNSNIEVTNEATSGHTSEDGLEKLGRISASDADIVVLSFGGNDLRHGHSVEAIAERMANIVGTLQKAGKEVVLVGIDPADLLHLLEEKFPESDMWSGVTDDFLESIRGIYSNLQENFQIQHFKRSLHSGLELADLEDDGIHPKESGMRKIAQDLSGHIQQAAQKLRAEKRIQGNGENVGLQR